MMWRPSLELANRSCFPEMCSALYTSTIMMLSNCKTNIYADMCTVSRTGAQLITQ